MLQWKWNIHFSLCRVVAVGTQTPNVHNGMNCLTVSHKFEFETGDQRQVKKSRWLFCFSTNVLLCKVVRTGVCKFVWRFAAHQPDKCSFLCLFVNHAQGNQFPSTLSHMWNLDSKSLGEYLFERQSQTKENYVHTLKRTFRFGKVTENNRPILLSTHVAFTK